LFYSFVLQFMCSPILMRRISIQLGYYLKFAVYEGASTLHAPLVKNYILSGNIIIIKRIFVFFKEKSEERIRNVSLPFHNVRTAKAKKVLTAHCVVNFSEAYIVN